MASHRLVGGRGAHMVGGKMAPYSREFFELQIRFVQSVGSVLDCDAAELLYDYTMFRGCYAPTG